jgi:hypothetical protein
MIKKLITVGNQNVFIHATKEYVGKQVEVIAFTIDETEEHSAVNKIITHPASEKSVAKDWLSPEEYKPWPDL